MFMRNLSYILRCGQEAQQLLRKTRTLGFLITYIPSNPKDLKGQLVRDVTVLSVLLAFQLVAMAWSVFLMQIRNQAPRSVFLGNDRHPV